MCSLPWTCKSQDETSPRQVIHALLRTVRTYRRAGGFDVHMQALWRLNIGKSTQLKKNNKHGTFETGPMGKSIVPQDVDKARGMVCVAQ